MGCSSFAKFLLIALNVLFFIIGGVSLGLGIWVVADKNSLVDKLTQISSAVTTYNVPALLTSAAYVFLVSGAIILVISFFGCCGAWKKIRCLLILYGIIVLLILILEIAVIVTAGVFSNQIEGILKTALKKSLTDDYNSTLTWAGDGYSINIGNTVTLAWDIIQLELSCCGVNNGSDYSSATSWNRNFDGPNGSMIIPPTCCMLNNTSDALSKLKAKVTGKITFVNSRCPVTTSSSYYNTGCYDSIQTLIKTNSTVVIAISASILGIQFILVVLAFCLARQIQQGKD